MRTLMLVLVLLSFVFCAPSGAVAQEARDSGGRDSDPCGTGSAWFAPLRERNRAMSADNSEPAKSHGLIPVQDGLIVYDSNQGVCWLADANLAGDPGVQAQLGITGVNPNGTMNWATALNFVNALNSYDGGRGYLGHNNWQLPVTPLNDTTCSSYNNGGFGASCTGSALGNLYYVGLGLSFPNSAVPEFTDMVPPFSNLHPSLYWTLGQNSGGEVTFSFNTGLTGANTTKYNYFHVLPMTLTPIGAPPSGSGVLPYLTGPAAGKAVFDTNTGISWTLDANLAATNRFGLTGDTTITSPLNPPGPTLTVPLVDVAGAMLFETADQPGGWIAAMNQNNYAGTNLWMLPHATDLQKLFQDLNLEPGDPRLLARGNVGPFRHLQPFFYWACERDQTGSSKSPCNFGLHPGTPSFEYSFNFDNGFEGTDLESKEFYVMVYFPVPTH